MSPCCLCNTLTPERRKSGARTDLSVCLCIPTIVSRKRLGKHVPSATNTHTTIEELLEASFCMRSASCQRKVCVPVYVSLLSLLGNG
jgi:hypothetical protein